MPFVGSVGHSIAALVMQADITTAIQASAISLQQDSLGRRMAATTNQYPIFSTDWMCRGVYPRACAVKMERRVSLSCL